MNRWVIAVAVNSALIGFGIGAGGSVLDIGAGLVGIAIAYHAGAFRRHP